jgi:hypothetical protein
MNRTDEYNGFKIAEILKSHEKYMQHKANTKKAYNKYAKSDKGKEARRKAMRAFRLRQKEKESSLDKK